MKEKKEIQDEVLKVITPLKRAGVGVSVGVGKTLIGLKHMAAEYNDFTKFLIVAPKKSIFQTWKDEAVKFKLDHLIPQMKFSTYLSMKKQDLDYDVVYLDECHNLKENHADWLAMHPGKIIGLTGTPPKSKYSEHHKMVEMFCPIVCEYLTDDAIDDEILNDYRIVVHYTDLSRALDIPVKKVGKPTWFTSEVKTYTYWSERLANGDNAQICRIMRMKALQGFRSKEKLVNNILTRIQDDAIKTIVFANTKDQADRLCIHRYHTGDVNSEKAFEAFKKGKINTLSCVQQLSEGINIPGLKESIIMHSYGSSSPKFHQRLGRTLRLNPNEVCTVHVLCYRNTVDEDWVRDSLKGLDQTKIKHK